MCVGGGGGISNLDHRTTIGHLFFSNMVTYTILAHLQIPLTIDIRVMLSLWL